MATEITIWQADSGLLIPKDAKTVPAIAAYAAQLSARDKRQLVSAFDGGHYEMGLNFLWGKTITALKKELSTVGIGLLGEMLDRPHIKEDDDVEDVLSTRDAIRLAGELGLVSGTDALRLQHSYELINHFSHLDESEADIEEIDESEAFTALKACIKSVLGRPKIEVAKKFVEFRTALEGESLAADDPRVDMLKGSPYFFHKLTVNVLMNAAKRNSGAQLEHVLANINVLLPEIWTRLRDSEKWQVGQTYASTYSDGRSLALSGLKSALLKVKGFDFVPENLRSETFIKAAEAIIKAHEGLNNFYNESAPVNNLSKLGTTIPTPAIGACVTALLCVVLGNRYGVAWSAQSEANKMLLSLSRDRWQYYMNQVFPSDTRILEKLAAEEKPRTQWMEVVKTYDIADAQIKNRNVSRLLVATQENSSSKLKSAAEALYKEFYSKVQ